MTIRRRGLAVLGLAAIATPALAQQQQQPRPHRETPAVEQAVEALRAAMISVNRQQLEALTSRHLSYGHSAGRIENREQFIANLEARNAAFRAITLSNQTIDISEHEAVVRHTFTGETVNPAGVVSPVNIGILMVWRKEGNSWRLLARQAFTLPRT